MPLSMNAADKAGAASIGAVDSEAKEHPHFGFTGGPRLLKVTGLSSWTLLLAALAGILAAPQLAHATDAVLSFTTGPKHEMLLKVDSRRNITGEVRSGPSIVVSTVTGTNPAPGRITLQFWPSGNSDLSGSFTYDYKACGDPHYHETTCSVSSSWVSQDAPNKYSQFNICAHACEFFSARSDFERFNNIINWSTNWDNYVGVLDVSAAKVKRKRVIECLKTGGIRASPIGDDYLDVPAGLEYLAKSKIARCGFGKVSNEVTEKGSNIIPMVFFYGTFYAERPNPANLAAIVTRLKTVLQQAFTAEHLDADVEQTERGGLDFSIKIIGHSDNFPFPSGNWFKSSAEMRITGRSEPAVPSGKVQQVDFLVSGTEIFHAPLSARPTSDQFQPIAKVDQKLNDADVDAALAIKLANRLASRFNGRVTSSPEPY
jgi:hypothetical protein